jgi:hypothetical protein
MGPVAGEDVGGAGVVGEDMGGEDAGGVGAVWHTAALLRPSTPQRSRHPRETRGDDCPDAAYFPSAFLASMAPIHTFPVTP